MAMGDNDESTFHSGYVKNLIRSKITSGEDYKFVWNGWVPKKVNIHNWRADLNRLPTSDSLARRNIHVQSAVCKLCGEEMETVEHLYISCAIASQVWSKTSSWCGIQPVFAFSFRDLMEIPYLLRGDAEFKKTVNAIFMATTWSLWKHRNAVIFKHVNPSVGKVICEIVAVSSLWLKARSKRAGPISLLNFPFEPD